jgi:hypothetical protein
MDRFVEFSEEIKKLQEQLYEGAITYEEFFNATAVRVITLSQMIDLEPSDEPSDIRD